MTELQMGLIGLAVAAVGGVAGFNLWQERRQRKLAEAVFELRQQDVLLNGGAAGGKAEPVLGQPDGENATADDRAPMAEMPEAGVSAENRFAPLPEIDEGFADSSDALASEPPVEMLDPRFEYVATLELVDPVPVTQILASQRAVLHRVGKPVHWIAYNERQREWVRLSADNEFSVRRLRVGLQLVDRRGPVVEADVVLFNNAMQALAEELMAVAVMPPSQVLEQAQEMDRFCATLDIEIGINLVSRSSMFPGTKIRALAEAAGMELAPEGTFVRRDELGRVQFSLQNLESTPITADTLRTLSTHGLTFLIDVPCVENGERVFSQMTEVARRFADTLQGELVDDNRQPLTDVQLEHIKREFIGKPQGKMTASDLPAGSRRALRLFS